MAEISNNTDVTQKYDQLDTVLLSLSAYDSNPNTSTDESIVIRTQIADTIIADLGELTEISTSQDSTRVVSSAVEYMSVITADDQFIDDTVLNKAVSIMDGVQVPTAIYDTLISDPNFVDAYLKSVSDLLKFVDSQSNGRRLLLATNTIDE